MKQKSKVVRLQKSNSFQNQKLLENYVVSGALAFCTCGISDVCMIFPNRGYITGYGSTGLDIDVSVSDNFLGSFGFCKCLKKECDPIFANCWIETGKRQLVNGRHPLLVKSILVCGRGGAISFRNDGQNLEKQKFMLPEEYRKKIEKIITSKQSWMEKTDQIVKVYEEYLYSLYQQEFDTFSKIFEKYGRDSQELQIAEKVLGKTLQNGNIAIKEVARALGDDIIRIVPNNNFFGNQLITFANLVKPNAPADLKSRPLSNAIGKRGYDFSIWSRKWESGMRSDYLGNYLYGYNGIAYFKDFDLDDLFPSEPILKTPWGSIGEKNILSRGAIDVIRSANADKTDAEMLLLMAAGEAQVFDDKDIIKYMSSWIKGNWGDNEIDSQFVSDGIDDYYHSKGMDKSEVIRKERN